MASYLGRPSGGDSPFAIGDRAMRDTSSPQPPSQRNPTPRQNMPPPGPGSLTTPSPYGSVSDEARRRYEERYAKKKAEEAAKLAAESQPPQQIQQIQQQQQQQQQQPGPPGGYHPPAQQHNSYQQQPPRPTSQQQNYPPRQQYTSPPPPQSGFDPRQQQHYPPPQQQQQQQQAHGYGQRPPSLQRPPPPPQGYQSPPPPQQQQQQRWSNTPSQGNGGPPPQHQQWNQGGPPPPQQQQWQQPAQHSPPPPPVPAEDPELRAMFNQFDSLRSGQLSAYDLQRLLAKDATMDAREDCVKMLMNIFDTDRSGSINFMEFEGLYRYIQDWHGIFRRFDRDNSGLIDRKELHNALLGFGFSLPGEMVRKLEKRFAPPPIPGQPPAKGISFDRFLMACVTVKHYTEGFRRVDVRGEGRITMDYNQYMDMVLDAPS
ncbi:hypothetical protein IAR55_003162 [Kwoniella newhampshirensis]|uniref:EF-hand domain-containing protein n=1 Tax=Kwoniella newhampshirensis TaxID=1651941 RepID=A0AAW0YTD4_9TREE